MVTPRRALARTHSLSGAEPVLLSAPVTVTEHTDGLPHVRSTIAKMAKLAADASTTFPIRNLATRIVHDVPSKQYALECAVLYRWVRDNIRYRKDPTRVEWLQTPERTVKERAGDCDDQATLLAALIQSLGHETRFRTVGRTRDVQAHVAVEALVNGNWLSVDPVLEPPATSNAPRADLGRFAQRAPGADIHWSSEGRMLSGTQRARRRRRRGGLSGPVTARERTLWDWNPYYPPVGVALYSGSQPAQGGVPAQPSNAYRLDDAPAFWGNYNLRALQDRAGDAASPINYPLAGLGAAAAFPAYDAKYDAAANKKFSAINIQNSIAAFAEYAKRRGYSKAKPPPKGMMEDYLKRHHSAGTAAGAVKVLKVAAPVAAAFVPGVGPILAPAVAAAAFASKVIKAVKPVVSVARSVAPQVKAVTSIVKAAQPAAKHATPVAVARATKPATPTTPVAIAKAALAKVAKLPTWKQPHPTIAAKYPKNSKQVYDAKHSLFRVYVPKAGVSGLGIVRPTITFALGAAAASPAMSNMPVLAKNATDAVAAFIAKNGQPPQVSLPAVLAFQKADAQLSDDGKYGPNVQTAAAYWLNKSTSQMPGFAKPYAKYSVTWKPPVAMAPASSSAKPAASPAVVTQKSLAMEAVNAVRAFKSPPTGSVPAVLAFQKSDALLLDDGKYGPNVQLAAAYYLGVPTSTLPPFAKAFANTKVTWHPPGTTAPMVPTIGPAVIKPAPKPAAVAKPAAKPAAAPKPAQQIVQHTVTKPDGTKTVIVSAPGGAPIQITPGAPLPGYTEVGHEQNNPGLPPVPAAAAPKAAAKPAVKAKPVAKAKPVVKVKPAAAKPTKAPAALPVSQTTAERPFDAPIPAGSFVVDMPQGDTYPQAGPAPIPPGTSAIDWAAQNEWREESAPNNSLVWLAVAYLWLKQRKKAA